MITHWRQPSFLLLALMLGQGCSNSLEAGVDAAASGTSDASTKDVFAADTSASDTSASDTSSSDATDGDASGSPDAKCVVVPVLSHNADLTHQGATTDASGIYAFRVSFDVDRAFSGIQFMTATRVSGGGYGLRVEVRNDASGRPGDVILGAGSLDLDEVVGWKNLTLAWTAKASTPYWIVYDPTQSMGKPGAIYLSSATTGTSFTTYWGFAGFGAWHASSPTEFPWMVRFTGCAP